MTAPAEVLLVGAGPGDADLLTLDAERALAAARFVVADRCLAPLLDTLVAGPRVAWADDDRPAAELVLDALAGPGPIVRLYRGDPWFHPAGDVERARLRQAGVAWTSLPGVVEEIASLAAAGIPVQLRTTSIATTFLVDPAGPALPALPADAAHVVVVRTAELAATIAELAATATATDPALLGRAAGAVATGTGSKAPAVVRSTLGDLGAAASAAGLSGPGVVVVGPVAALDTRPEPRPEQDRRPVAVVGLVGGRPVGPAAEAALRAATLVAGSGDQLAATADLRRSDAATAIVGGGLGALDAVVAHPGPTCVLASGDPGFFGIARALRARLGTGTLEVHPAPSSVALAFARAGVSWDDAIVRSAHTGQVERLAAEVAVAPTAAVLCGPDAPPQVVAAALLAHGAHHALAVVAAHLAEPEEQITRGDLHAIAAGTFPHRAVLVVAHPAPTDGTTTAAAAAARPGGRPTTAFAHRSGMITKPEVRSVVLAKLDLPTTGVLWDLGAGSASVAIEAALAAPGVRVVAVERHRADTDRAVANAAALGALVEVVEGDVLDVLDELPTPDRVFVGGGGLDVLDAAWHAVRPGGVVVATFAAIDRAAEAFRRLGSLVQVAVGQAGALPDGGIRFAADNPVFVAWGTKAPASTETGTGIPTGVVAVGVGCSTHATEGEVRQVVDAAVAQAPDATATTPLLVATVDRRRDHPAITGRPLVTFPASLLATVDVPTPSAVVDDAVGTPSVAEAAALLAAGPGARLVVTKQRGPTATAAVAVGPRPLGPGLVTVVGLGPGGARHRTPAAVDAVRSADAVVGYGPYVDAVADLVRPAQRLVRSTMGAESDRADAAVALAAAGWRVALVSSGDAGVFGMASTALDAAAGVHDHAGRPVAVVVVPGVTAAHAGAGAAGAPLAGAHATITLSDILIPWERIEAQLRAAAGAGLALALYNPRSKGRPDHLARALAVIAEVLAPETPVVIVTAAGDDGEAVITATLATVDPTSAGMRSVVLVGTADTVVDDVGRVVTSRHHPHATAARDETRP